MAGSSSMKARLQPSFHYLIQVLSLITRLNGRCLLWLLAPGLGIRLVARHSLLLAMLYLIFFAWGKFRSMFRNRISFVKRSLAYLSGRENEYLLTCSLKQNMLQAKSFDEWHDAASRLDAFTGRMAWKDIEESDLYDYRRIRADLETMRELAKERDIEGLMRFLRSRLQRNVGGIGNPKLYGHLLSGTKTLAEDYTREVVQCLNLVAMETDSKIPSIRKLAFFMETRHAYGRSALLLSGGSTLGLYHAGVVKALLSKKLLPRIISGTSVGSIFAAMIGTRTDSELEPLLEEGAQSLDVFPSNTGSIWRKLSRVWNEGYLYNMSVMEQYIRDNVGDFSFQEAYARTGRILNIAVSAHGSLESTETLLLNYLTAPNVLIWSAVCASCAIPLIFQPVELMSKEPDGRILPHFSRGVMWSDGSFRSDLPMHRLAEMFNVNHFIVSQVNPHVIPFMAPQQMLSTSSSLIAKSILYLGGELRDLILRMSSLIVSKSLFSNLESIAFQNYLGHITLYPKPSLRNFLKLLENPTHEMYYACVQQAQLYTWRHMTLISEHCDVEFELDACVRQVRAALLRNSDIPLMVEHRHPSENLGSRVRSWSSDQFQIFRRAEETCLQRPASYATMPHQQVMAESAPAAVTTTLVDRLMEELPANMTESTTNDPQPRPQQDHDSSPIQDHNEQDLLSSELTDVDMMPLP